MDLVSKEWGVERSPSYLQKHITTEDHPVLILRLTIKNLRLSLMFLHFSAALTMDEVLAQGLIFFMAGYHTTSTSIACLLNNLALNPEIQEKVREEIIKVAGDKVRRKI